MEGRLVHEVRAENVWNATDATAKDRQADSRGAYFPKEQGISHIWSLALGQCDFAEWRSKVSSHKQNYPALKFFITQRRSAQENIPDALLKIYSPFLKY